MKTHLHSNRENAVALIIVLAMLVLLSGLIVSFMTSVGNERAASFVSNNQTTSRQLADSTVNLVISQIREATSQGGTEVAIPTTWASQPGAIRTLSGSIGAPKTISNGSGGASGVKQWTYSPGSNDYTFKLYSAEKMKVKTSEIVGGGSAWDSAETGVIEKWDHKLSESEREKNLFFGYVDLNEPIVTPMPESLTAGNPNIVEPRYPIIDPRAKYTVTEGVNNTPDPGIVDGFDVKTTGLLDANLKFITKDNKGKRGATQSVPYIPMPVKWLYMMQDGSVAAANDKDGKIEGASANNPIIGRTAFWTDDDSCRLNINTASEGTFWDTPHASGEQESGNVDASGILSSSPASLNLGAAQPVRGEYQRYPGHPATTSLSPVVGWMWGILPKDPTRATRDPLLVSMKDAISQLAPFSPYGKKGHVKAPNDPPNSTSIGASNNPDTDYPQNDDPATRPDPQLTMATRHLYANVDELVFKHDRVTTAPNAPTALNSDKITPESLEKVRFFLTAYSRAPEINLFGRPRVTFWPVNAKEENRTAYDDLFAFTSTLYKDPQNRNNDKTFFFTRHDAKNAVNDYRNDPPNSTSRNQNPKLMEYLQLMTGDGGYNRIPSFGGNFAAKYPNIDPGFAGGERNQILVQIFDYCRAVNLVDTSTRNRAGAFRPYTPFYGKGSQYQDFSQRSTDWSGQVTPGRFDGAGNFADINTLQGLGRFPTISEAAIIFYRTGGIRPDTFQAEMRAALVFEMTNPMAGNPAIRETYYTKVSVERETLVTVPGVPAVTNLDIQLVSEKNDQISLTNIVNVASHDVGWSRGYMPTLGFMNQVVYYPEPATKPNPDPNVVPPVRTGTCAPKKFVHKHADSLEYKRSSTSTIYPYVSKTFPAPPQTGTPMFSFTGGRFKVQIWSGEAPDDVRSQLVQTIYIDFGEKPVKVGIPNGKASSDASLEKRITGRQDDRPGFPNGNGFEDVVRSFEYVGASFSFLDKKWSRQPLNQQGDFRLSITRREVPSEAFAERSPADYYTETVKSVHGLQRGWGSYYEGSKPALALPATPGGRGTFATGATFRDDKSPILPAGINGVKMFNGGPGDWDRGLSKHIDGSLGGKVDEGNVYFDYTSGGDGGRVPYFRGRGIEETGKTFFSPNRQLSSAVMFGSLPTGVMRTRPWQTLLFRPDRSTISHPGAQSANHPADHLLLDLFNLPIVEPYAISEPFSSGGKVNLNYVIAPFGYAKGDSGKRGTNNRERSYLRRDTALRGVLKSVRFMAIPTNQLTGGHSEGPANTATPFRFEIDAEKTLDQFEDRLKDPLRGLFRSASEICDMDLYPPERATAASPVPNPTLTTWTKFWDQDFAQTGDNMRERPYSHIYPRVTTKSNVFTVYMRCQALKKVAGTAPDKFDPKSDKVVGAYRGSATIERFIDSNDPQLASYDANAVGANVDKYYRFRVLATKQFLPR